MLTCPCLLLTRPRGDSERFAKQLRAHGWQGEILIFPLQEIVLHPPEPESLQAVRSLVFTSQNAVAALRGATDRRDWPVWAVGPRTAAAARAAGFCDVRQSGGDAAALLQDMKATPPPAPVMHLCGQHVASDIVRALQAQGLQAWSQIVYAQRPIPMDTATRGRLERGGDFILPVFSPRSAMMLARALEPLVMPDTRLHLVAISDAAAQPMRQDRIATCRIAATPDGAAMGAAVMAAHAALEHAPKPR